MARALLFDIDRIFLEPDLKDVFDAEKRIELVGTGSFGCVYKIYNKKLQQYTALKAFCSLINMPAIAMYAYIKREVRTLQQTLQKVNSEYVIKILNFYERYYLLEMEYAEGKPLSAYIYDATLNLNHRLEIAVKIVQGILAIHSSGIIHRDINPNNIRVKISTNDQSKQIESLKICDFGLAVPQQEEQSSRVSHGTPAYISPERAANVILLHQLPQHIERERVEDFLNKLGLTKVDLVAEMEKIRIGQASDYFELGTTLYELFFRRTFIDGGFVARMSQGIHPDFDADTKDFLFHITPKEADIYRNIWGLLKNNLLLYYPREREKILLANLLQELENYQKELQRKPWVLFIAKLWHQNK